MSTQRHHLRLRRAAIRKRQGFRRAGFFDCKLALDLHESKYVQVHVTAGLAELTTCAVQGQRHVAGWSRQHIQCCLALSLTTCLQAVVDHASVQRLAVHRYREVFDSNQQAFNTNKICSARLGLHRCPLARNLPARDLLGRELFTQQGQTDIHITKLQPNVTRAHKGVQAASAQQQHVDIYRHSRLVYSSCADHIGQRYRAALLFNSKVAGYLHHAKNVQLKRARGAQQLAVSSVHIQAQTGVRAGLYCQALRLVIHQRAIDCRQVDFHA